MIELTLCRRLAYTMFSASVIESPRIMKAITDGIADWLEWERTHRSVRPSSSLCRPI